MTSVDGYEEIIDICTQNGCTLYQECMAVIAAYARVEAPTEILADYDKWVAWDTYWWRTSEWYMLTEYGIDPFLA